MKKWVYLIPYISLLNGISFNIGGLNARLDQIYNLIIFSALIIMKVINGRFIRFKSQELILLTLIITAFLASNLNAPDKNYSIRQTINVFSVSAVFFLITATITSLSDLTKLLVNYLKGATIASAIGTVFFIFSFITKIPIYGINLVQNESEPFGIYLTMVEPNLYGGYMLTVFLVAFCLNAIKGSNVLNIPPKWIKLGLIFSSLGVFLSFTRGVWLSIMICLVIYVSYSFQKNKFAIIKNLVIFASVISLIYFGVRALKIETLEYKLDNLVSTDGGTGEGRMQIYGVAYENYFMKRHFFIGNGTYSFASFFNSGSDYSSESNAYIGSLLLSFLHDYGIIGLLLFIILFIYVISAIKIKKYFKLHKYMAPLKDFQALNIGLKLAVIGIVIASNTSTSFVLTFPWMVFGMCVAYKRILERLLINDAILKI